MWGRSDHTTGPVKTPVKDERHAKKTMFPTFLIDSYVKYQSNHDLRISNPAIGLLIASIIIIQYYPYLYILTILKYSIELDL